MECGPSTRYVYGTYLPLVVQQQKDQAYNVPADLTQVGEAHLARDQLHRRRGPHGLPIVREVAVAAARGAATVEVEVDGGRVRVEEELAEGDRELGARGWGWEAQFGT